MGGSKSRFAMVAVCAALFGAPTLALAGPGKGGKKHRAEARGGCAEAGRVYFQRLPPAPVWPRYEAMEVELYEGKGDTCNMRMVVTQKETLELLTYRAVCKKTRSAYKCQGERKTGASWFQVSGRGKNRRMVWRLPDPGVTLTGLANRDLTDRIRTWRGTITIELVISRDRQADDRS